MTRHPDLDVFSGIFFDLPRTDLHKDIGGRIKFKRDDGYLYSLQEYTIVGVQRIYDGSLAYRVMADDDTHRFGRPAKVDDVVFVRPTKTYRAYVGNRAVYFGELKDAIAWVKWHYKATKTLRKPRKGELVSFSGPSRYFWKTGAIKGGVTLNG